MTSQRSQPIERQNLVLAGAVGLFCLAVYLATAPFEFFSMDEMAVYVVARNLAVRGSVLANELFSLYEEMLPGAVTAPGVGGMHFALKDIGMSVAAAPLIWLGRLVGVSQMRAAMLTGVLATAATVVIVVWFVAQQGYSKITAMLAGLGFGLGTMAWPYAGTLFTQSMVALGLMIGIVGTEIGYRERSWIWAAVGGLGVGFAGINAQPVFALGLVHAAYLMPWEALCQKDWRFVRRALPSLVAYGVTGGLFVAALGAYNTVRFGAPVSSGHVANAGDRALFSLSHLPVGLFGQLLSAPRGLLWYVPLIILSVVGLVLTLRSDDKRPTWLMVSQVIMVTLLYSAYVFWNGGQAWGPRHLVDIMPALALMAVPTLDQAIKNDRGWRWLVGLVFAASILTQLRISLYYDHDREAARFLATDPNVGEITFASLTDPALLPQAGTLGLASARVWTVLWYQDDFDSTLGGASLGIVAVSGAGLWLVLQGRRVRTGLVAQGLAAFGLLVLVLARYPNPQQIIPEVDDILETVYGVAAPDDVVLLMLPDTFWLWQISAPGEIPELSLPAHDVMTPTTETVLEAVTHSKERVWFVSEGQQAAQPTDVDRWLIAYGFAGPTQWVGGHYRVQPYVLMSDEWSLSPIHAEFIDVVELELAGVRRDDNGLLVELVWAAEVVPEHDYNVFVHVLDSGGTLVAQHDGPPVLGLANTTMWSPGQQVDDRRYVPLPEGLLPGQYTVRAGLYSWQTGDRLTTASGDDGVVIGKINWP